MHVYDKGKAQTDVAKKEEFSYSYGTIKAKDILADESYNRSINHKQVERIIANFNQNLVNPAKVSYRDGKYWIFDGNHTVRALTERSGNNGDTPIYCKIYQGMTKEDEARLFAEQNGIHTNVSQRNKIRSLAVANDPEVAKFLDTMQLAGLTCGFSRVSKPGQILCYDTAFKIYKQKGRKHLYDVLRIIYSAWGGRSDSLKKEIVCGMDILLTKAGSNLDKARLIERLSQESPKTIISMGKGESAYTGNLRYAVVIAKIYNKRLAQKSRIDMRELTL